MKIVRFFGFLVGAAAIGLFFAGCDRSATDASGPGQNSAQNAAAKPAPTGPVQLQLKWPVGARYRQHMEIVQDVETSMAGMPQTMKQDMEMNQEFALAVLAERPDGGRELELDFVAMQMLSRAGDRVLVNFDSAGESLDTKNPMADLLRSLVGTRIKFILDANHQIARLEGLQEFRNHILTNAPSQARGSVTQMLNEDLFRQMINFGQGLPDRPVSPGDSWSAHNEIPMGPLGIVHLELQYVFKGYSERNGRSCALLDFNGILKTKPGRDNANPNMRMSVEDGTTSGQTWFDPDLGMIVASEVKQEMKMNMELTQLASPDPSAAPAPPRTMTAQVQQTIKITVDPEPGA